MQWETERYLWGALLLIAGAGLNGIITPFIRRRLQRADDLQREHFGAVIERVDLSQHNLARRLTEDREHAAKHFEGLWSGVKKIDTRLTRLETHHAHNHPRV